MWLLNEIIKPKFKLILPIANSNISFGFYSHIWKLIKIISYKGDFNILIKCDLIIYFSFIKLLLNYFMFTNFIYTILFKNT